MNFLEVDKTCVEVFAVPHDFSKNFCGVNIWSVVLRLVRKLDWVPSVMWPTHICRVTSQVESQALRVRVIEVFQVKSNHDLVESQ